MQLFQRKQKPVYSSYQFLVEFKKLKKVIKSCITYNHYRTTSVFVHSWIDRVVLDKNFEHPDLNMVSSLSIALIKELTAKHAEIQSVYGKMP